MKSENRNLRFRKSSFSQYESSKCVEVAMQRDLVVVRDSKNPGGPILKFTPDEWRAFIKGVKNREFDLP